MNELSLMPAQIRRDIYKLLSDCYFVPDENLVQTLSSSKTLLEEAAPEFASCIPEDHEIEGLKIDHAKLFVGPFELRAPPYGSVYLEGNRRVAGESTMDAADRYTEEGLDVCLAEPPDHIAIELEYMYLLVFRQIEALGKSDFEASEKFRKKQQDFLMKHLGAWVFLFADKVEAGAEARFYTQLARFTKSFIETEFHLYVGLGVEPRCLTRDSSRQDWSQIPEIR